MRLPLSCLLLDLLAVHSSAHPEALPEAIPEAIPEALPEALAEADPQTYTNNAPFSGAIYIVNPNGQAVTAEGTNVCPVSASVSCSTIGQPSCSTWTPYTPQYTPCYSSYYASPIRPKSFYTPIASCPPSPPDYTKTCVPQAYPNRCCPDSYTCAAPPNSNGLIGCCPAGNSCGGAVNVQSVTTITVQASQQTDVVYVQPSPTTAVVYANPQPTEVGPYQGGFCSTLTANGPGLPTTSEGDCGTILIVSEAAIKLVMGYGICATVVFLHVMLGRMLNWI